MYRLERKAKLERPVPGYSLYEGRTRGKRLRYTFDDNEDEDSDAAVRRSTRNSGRESSAGPSAPTVTASGRQVRSRATGMYGETLLSGQTTEGVSPATGDYVRSDASEEPDRPAHGRSTRAQQHLASRSAGAANPKKRNFESYVDEDISEEEDATSWNGDDEEEDEPEHMDLDDEEEESDEEPSGTEEEPQSLLVRLKIGKEASSSFEKGPIPIKEDEGKLKEPPQAVPLSTDPPLSGMDAARTQTVAAPVPAPAATAAPLPQPLPPPTSLVAQIPADHNPFSAPEPPILPSMTSIAQHNGLPPQPLQPSAFAPVAAVAPMAAPPVAHVTQLPPQSNEPHTLPPLGSALHAPACAAQEALKPQVQPSFPPTKPDAPRSPKPFAHTLPTPTPAAHWQ